MLLDPPPNQMSNRDSGLKQQFVFKQVGHFLSHGLIAKWVCRYPLGVISSSDYMRHIA